MNTQLSLLPRGAGFLCACAALALGSTAALADDSSSGGADAFPDYESYIKLSGYMPSINGDSAAFAQRNGAPAAGSYGIEDLYFTKNLNDSTTLDVNGKALTGSEDYLLSLNISNDNLGSLDVGYKRFRTFYDGVGGFFPLADLFEAMSPENLHVDRSAFWVTAKFARPDCPVVTISFHDEIRTGDKDSTIWAPVVNPNVVVSAGAAVGTAAPSNTPYIDPNLLALDEHHDILDASVEDKLGSTDETLKASLDWVGNLDTRYYTKYPNPDGITADATVNVLDDQEKVKAQSLHVLNQTETVISPVLSVETNVSYQHSSGTDGGEWITPAYSTTLKEVYPAITAGNIYAAPTLDDFAANLFIKVTPFQNFLAEAGIKDEYNVISDGGSYITTSLASTAKSLAASQYTLSQDVTYSHNDDHTATPDISLSYRGFSNLSLYTSFDERIDHGNQHWVNPYAAVSTAGVTGVVTTTPQPIGDVFFQAANQDYENFKIGATWDPTSWVTVRAELYRKDHENRFIGSDAYVGTASYGGLYATGYLVSGANLTVTVKPLPEWSFTTRYQPQAGNMSVLGNTTNNGNGTEVTSGRIRTQIISETADWTPYKQFYAQANLNVVYNYIQTAYPYVASSATSNVPTPIQNANNNYVTSSVLFGFVLDKLDDAQIQGYWQQATNYNPQVAYGGQPYGATFLFESATIGVKHKFSDWLMAEAKVGYLRSTDGTTGSFTNYRGPLAYVSLEYKL